MAFHVASQRWVMISRSWISPQLLSFQRTTRSARAPSEIVESSGLSFNLKKIGRSDVGYATDTRNPSHDDDKERRSRWSTGKFLSRETISLISSRKKEPDWMLEFRLKAYEEFLKMEEPPRSDQFPAIDFIDVFTELEKKANLLNCSFLDDDDVYAYYSSSAAAARSTAVSLGVILCPISEAVRKYPDLVKQYLGRVVPPEDNFYAALNSAVFTDGTFVYVPKNVKLPVHISPPVRIRSITSRSRRESTFRRTLIVADEGSCVKYFEGPSGHGVLQSYSSFSPTDVRLDAGVVELYCHECAEMEYLSLHDWCCHRGARTSRTFTSNVFSFDTEKGVCEGAQSKICWSHVETGISELDIAKEFLQSQLWPPDCILPYMIANWGDDD